MMKLALAFGLICLSAAYAQEVSCDECQDGVMKLKTRLLTEESLAEQAAILVATLCPAAEDPAACEAVIGTHWALIGGAVYPVFFDENLCGALGACMLREWTCDNCVAGIGAMGEILVAPETQQAVNDLLKGEAFCGQEAAPESCPDVVDILVPAALPVLAGVLGETATQLCQEELGVC